jgi:hypothetical protein
MPRVLPAVSIATAYLLCAAGADAQCLHKDGESTAERVRRDDAVRYLMSVNAAQTRAQQADGRYLSLTEIGSARTAPVGFVPRLVVDRWSYIISLKDVFDSCGFTLFTDEHGVIYESLPSQVAQRESPRFRMTLTSSKRAGRWQVRAINARAPEQ